LQLGKRLLELGIIVIANNIILLYNLPMESYEQSESEIINRELFEIRAKAYEQTEEAIDALYAMSLENDADDQRIRERYFKMSLGELQDRMMEVDRDTFFDAVALFDRIVEIEKNYESRNQFFHNPDIMHLVSSAKHAFSWGLERAGQDQKLLEGMNKEEAALFFKVLVDQFSVDIDYILEKAVNFVREHKKTFEELSGKLGDKEIYKRFVELEEFLKSPTFEENLAHAIQNCMFARKTDEIQYGEALLREAIEKYGLDYYKLHDAWWSHRHSSGFPEPSIFTNIVRIHEIEAQKEGTAQLLFKEYGIRNFERYPAELLLAQAEAHKDGTKPYGIILNPENDWNGAFSNDSQIWAVINSQLKHYGYFLRVVESESKQEIARRLISLDKWYGKSHKISFAFIGGHGTENSIKFGGEAPRNSISIDDLAGHGVKKTNKFFELNPTIVLVSCSTGAERGIGQKLSEMLNAKVIAPKAPTALRRANVFLEKDQLVFEVSYGNKFGLPDKDDSKQTYVGGKPTVE